MSKITIILDPGHGGHDPGTTGNGLLEKELTLDIARQVAVKLSSYDAVVKLTRDDDSYLSLEARSNFANNLNADYFLSIHINAGGGTGFESFIYIDATDSRTAIYRSVLHNHITDFLKDYGMVDRGEKKANFAVLRETNMPSALIENLFIDSAKDADLLKDREFINALADSVARGLIQSLNLVPVAPPIWDPRGEIAKLKASGYIVDDHPADAQVTWGEFATVVNRIIAKLGK